MPGRSLNGSQNLTGEQKKLGDQIRKFLFKYCKVDRVRECHSALKSYIGEPESLHDPYGATTLHRKRRMIKNRTAGRDEMVEDMIGSCNHENYDFEKFKSITGLRDTGENQNNKKSRRGWVDFSKNSTSITSQLTSHNGQNVNCRISSNKRIKQNESNEHDFIKEQQAQFYKFQSELDEKNRKHRSKEKEKDRKERLEWEQRQEQREDKRREENKREEAQRREDNKRESDAREERTHNFMKDIMTQAMEVNKKAIEESIKPMIKSSIDDAIKQNREDIRKEEIQKLEANTEEIETGISDKELFNVSADSGVSTQHELNLDEILAEFPNDGIREPDLPIPKTEMIVVDNEDIVGNSDDGSVEGAEDESGNEDKSVDFNGEENADEVVTQNSVAESDAEDAVGTDTESDAESDTTSDIVVGRYAVGSDSESDTESDAERNAEFDVASDIGSTAETAAEADSDDEVASQNAVVESAAESTVGSDTESDDDSDAELDATNDIESTDETADEADSDFLPDSDSDSD